jgi:site-specific recombinase XerD
VFNRRSANIDCILETVTHLRHRAMFMLMLRCVIRVEEVAKLTTDAVDLGSHRTRDESGKGSKDRIVSRYQEQETS